VTSPGNSALLHSLPSPCALAVLINNHSVLRAYRPGSYHIIQEVEAQRRSTLLTKTVGHSCTYPALDWLEGLRKLGLTRFLLPQKQILDTHFLKRVEELQKRSPMAHLERSSCRKLTDGCIELNNVYRQPSFYYSSPTRRAEGGSPGVSASCSISSGLEGAASSGAGKTLSSGSRRSSRLALGEAIKAGG